MLIIFLIISPLLAVLYLCESLFISEKRLGHIIQSSLNLPINFQLTNLIKFHTDFQNS